MSMSWKEFELYCDDLLRKSLKLSKYRVKYQHRGEYNGRSKKMDFHIAQIRQGGKGFVVDCKHYPKAKLPRRQIDKTIEYQRDCRASAAIILLSSVSNCPKSVKDYAERMGVKIIVVDIEWRAKIPMFQRFLLRKKIGLR